MSSPASTWRAPIQSTNVIPPNTSVVASAVSSARIRPRRTATRKERSTALLKRSVCSRSSVNACTVCTALIVSAASALASATRSWESRDSRRSRRPSISKGPTISGIAITIISASCGLVATSSTSEPSSVIAERSVIEMP